MGPDLAVPLIAYSIPSKSATTSSSGGDSSKSSRTQDLLKEQHVEFREQHEGPFYTGKSPHSLRVLTI